jgi:asparagine synthase (glutamine-hydrolysing)
VCGIAGFTHIGNPRPPRVLQDAIESIRHRGPNQQGVFESDSVSLGAVRLKIIDLEGGDQPILANGGDLVIAFNGEIYNHVALRRELEELGHTFASHCDTEVVLKAFAQWDTDCFAKLRGMFAVAFWQESQKRLVLARDRLGIKPLYYTLRDGDLHFGSELKAVFAHPDIPRQLCDTGLAYFLSLNYVPTPYTLAEGITKVVPGSWLEFKRGRIVTGRYWSNQFRPEKWALEDATARLDELLSSSITEHLISDVPLGVWASGGLDSSAILHYAAQASSGPLNTFSISFAGRRFDESEYFRLLAKTYNTSHHEFDVSGDLDLTAAIHELAYYSDEPSADAGALPVWFLSRMTARHVTVALSGEGADEIFGGYQTYLADRYARRARKVPKFLLASALKAVNRLPVSDDKIALEYKLKRFLAGALLCQDDAHFFWNGTFTQAEQKSLGAAGDLPPARLVSALKDVPARNDVINRYLFVDQHYYLPDDILYKCDRMSMAHSLEVRPPFLDHRIVEFAGTLPEHFKVNGSTTKFVMRELLKSKLPAAILGRRKEGLDIPAHDWLRGPLRPLLEQELGTESVKKAGIFSPSAIRNLVDRHLRREANVGYHLWGLLSLHLWVKRWNISTVPAGEDVSQSADAYSAAL